MARLPVIPPIKVGDFLSLRKPDYEYYKGGAVTDIEVNIGLGGVGFQMTLQGEDIMYTLDDYEIVEVLGSGGEIEVV